MKWINKGHEFDELGAVFQKNNIIVLIGKRSDNDAVREKLNFLDDIVIEMIDTDFNFVIKLRSSKNSFINFTHRVFNKIKRIKKQIEFKKFYKENSLHQQSEKTLVLSKTVCVRGCGGGGGIEYFERTDRYLKNKNIFLSDDFFQKYLSIFAVYVCNKVYLYNVGIIVTTVCNLNCKYCLDFTPYNKNMKHRHLDELKNEVDILFSCVDRLVNLSVCGGETLLYPYLGELLQYISCKYRDKIETIGVTTNGTIMPSVELCGILKKCKITVYTDDYSKTVPNVSIPYKQFIKKIMEHGIETHQVYIEYFYKTFPPLGNYSLYNDQSLTDKFDKCIQICDQVHYQDQKNGRIAACCYEAYALGAGLIKDSVEDYYDINGFSNSVQSKKELVEFRLGYTNKGYVEFCKYCNGFPSINPHIAKNGAEQAKGKLTWDSNNPYTSY
jgi:organic radical activating enzyme